MVFTGYCTTAELAKFLDIGVWQNSVSLVSSYSSNNLSIDTSGADGIDFYLVDGLIILYADGVEISSDDYTINLDNGNITFSTEPTVGSEITADYYLVDGISNDDLEYYITLGAYEIETETRQKFREVTIIDYELDTNEGFDYVSNVVNKPYIRLSYGPILEVTELTVNGTTVTPSTLKIFNNMVMLTSDSEVSEFIGKADSIKISFKYGITDTVNDRTDEDLMLLKIVKEANKVKSGILLATSPLGKNILFENGKITQESKGDVRPEMFNEGILNDFNKLYLQYINKLRMYSGSII